MSYQVLARKYRPKSFATLVGQEHVVRALTHALEQQRLHHAYLFTGTRGVGKTTLSRILAKSFNCEKGITAEPCGVCEACTAIDAGRFVDYIEMDAASNRGVDEMAALLEQAIYAPSNARFKVYMIDEVHMLTNHAFNAMLKTLEEPPEHVKFILATTDPQKIPVTVLSRCLQFNLKQMPPGHIISHLENILAQEQIAYQQPALRLLAQGAHGSMRDALSLTDQAIAYAAGQVSLEAVQGMLGALDQSYLIRILDALAVQDGAALLALADEMAARSLSYKNALQDLASILHQITVAQLVPGAVADDLPEREQILRLAGLFSKEQIQLFYQIVLHGRNDIALAPDEYAGFSMCLLRLLAFHPFDGTQFATPAASGGPARPQPRAQASSGMPAGAASRPAPSSAALQAPGPARTQAAALSPLQSGASAASAAAVPNTVTGTVPNPAAGTAPAGSDKPAGKPLSPAMAALQAARAMSAKGAAASANAGAGPAAAPVSAPVPPAAPVIAPPAMPAAPAASSVAPVAASLSQSLSQPSATAAQALSAEPADPDPRSTQADDDAALQAEAPQQAAEAQPDYRQDDEFPDMPPPWDDDVLASSHAAPASGSAAAPAVREASPPAVEPAPLVEPVAKLAADRVLWRAPVPALNWDGAWPELAAGLPVRGVAQQLAQQSELADCRSEGATQVFRLRVPLPTLLSASAPEKLAAALSERFGITARIETEIAAVELTAHARAVAARELRQREAEQAIRQDPFVQQLMRDFGAAIVAGSVRPI